jgi:hypothetical protein
VTLLLRVVGWLMILAGIALMILIASGAADGWLEENWTCSTGRGIPRETECGFLEAEWSAFVLAGAIALVGLVVAALASARDTRP